MSLALDAAELLFNCLANVDCGDWTQQLPRWQAAAAKAREAYHRALDSEAGMGPEQAQQAATGRLSDQRILNVLRSDYEMVVRLASDRIRSLDLAYPAEPVPPVPPGREDNRQANLDAMYARDRAENEAAQAGTGWATTNVRQTPELERAKQAEHRALLQQRAAVHWERRADETEQQLHASEDIRLTLAREVDQLQAKVATLEQAKRERFAEADGWLVRAQTAEAALSDIRRRLDGEQPWPSPTRT
jgi:hypothetical protein